MGMGTDISDSDLRIFSTCVQSVEVAPEQVRDQAARIAQWSDSAGCTGMLIYADNRLVDPWLLAQVAMQSTDALCPLVAVQPVYMHPYAAAKMVASLGHLYGRRVFLNMIAGGFLNDLRALADETPHDRRYDRLIEYTSIVKALLERSGSGEGHTFEGDFYTVRGLRLDMALAPELQPGVFVSGSSDAGLAAAESLGATAVQYPTPPEEFPAVDAAAPVDFGIRVGVIARDDSANAWRIAEDRFPESREGRIQRKMATRVSDSHWHRSLADVEVDASERSPYWLLPFEQYQTMCPYLVGSYDEVARMLAEYAAKGYRTYIVDIPREPDDLYHTRIAFDRASSLLSGSGA